MKHVKFKLHFIHRRRKWWSVIES